MSATVAVPSAVAKSTVTLPVAAGVSVTVKVAVVVPALPSVTATSLMESPATAAQTSGWASGTMSSKLATVTSSKWNPSMATPGSVP